MGSGSGSGVEQVKVRVGSELALALTEAELELRPVLPADEADEVVEPELRVPLEDRPDSSEVRRGEVR